MHIAPGVHTFHARSSFHVHISDVVLLMCLSEEAIDVMKRRWKAAKQHAKVDGLRNLLDGGVLAEVFAREDMPALQQYIQDSEARESTALAGRGAVVGHIDWAWEHLGRPRGAPALPAGGAKGARKGAKGKGKLPRPSADAEAVFDALKPPGAALCRRTLGNMIVMYEGEIVRSVSYKLRLERGINPTGVALRAAWGKHIEVHHVDMPEDIQARIDALPAGRLAG